VVPGLALAMTASRASRMRRLKLPRFRRVVLELGDYGSVVTASIAAS
jgi:hypothetical protein